ncbi:MAG TPA: YIP1 family protein [Terracidiphilus sp.]|jgi:hypothetical protein|nr:YIP1 family protein [Terracidiphilus sp.]
MSDPAVQAAEPVPGLSQMQRVTGIFTAPSKTFDDIKRGNKSWWLPFIIVVVTGAFMIFAITNQVTWQTVYENQQRAAPAFAKRMMENLSPEQKAAADKKGPINQEVTWVLSPVGLLLINMAAALVLWPTINFGFGGKATFGSILAVTMYATLVLWPIKLLLGGIALFAGASPDAFSPQNVAGTNFAYYMSEQSGLLWTIARSIDPLIFWNLALTSIGVAIVAGVKRTSGYIAVFGWWALLVIIGVAFAAITG